MSDNNAANSRRSSYWQALSGFPPGPIQVPTGFYGDYNPNINAVGVSGSHYGANDSRSSMSTTPMAGISKPLMPMRPQPYPPLNLPSSYFHSTGQYYPPSQYRSPVPDYGLRDLNYGVHENAPHSPLSQSGYLPSTPQYYPSTPYRTQMTDSAYGLRNLNYQESEPSLQNLTPLSSYAHSSHHYPSNFGQQQQDLDQGQRSAGNEFQSGANEDMQAHNLNSTPVSLQASNPAVSLQTPTLKVIKEELMGEVPKPKRKYTKRKKPDKVVEVNPEPKVAKKRGRKKKEVDENADSKARKQSLYKVSLSSKRRENMAYPKNSFLLRYSDLDEEDHDFIWLVDNHQLLAKFVPNQNKSCTLSKEAEQTDTVRYYTRTDRYTGWFSHEFWNYIDFTDRVTVDGLSEISVRFPNRQEIDEMRGKLLKRRDEEEKVKTEIEGETAEKKMKLEQEDSNDGNGNEDSNIDVEDKTNSGFARSEGSNEEMKEGFDESTNDGVDEFPNEVGNGRANLANIEYEIENGEDHQEEWEDNDDSNDDIDRNENEAMENQEESSDDDDSNQENDQSDGDEEDQKDGLDDQNEQYEDEEDSEESE